MEFKVFPQSLRVNLGQLFIIPTPEFLIVQPNEANDSAINNTAKITADIYKTLCHTPITGIGHNFKFDLEQGEKLANHIFEHGKFISKTLSTSTGKDIGTLSQKKTEALKFEDEKYILNLTVESKDAAQSISFNFHYGVAQNLSNDEIISLINEYHNNYESAKIIVKDIIG